MRFYFLFAFLVLCALPATAETIHLKDGRSVEGKVIEKNGQSVKVDVNGVGMTYYADEVADIDGIVLAPPTPLVPAVPAAVPTKKATSTLVSGDDKRQLILKFMDAFGTRQALTKNFETLLKQVPAAQAQEADKIRERVKIDELIERLIPVYDRNFTMDELKAFIAFYQSSEGVKLLKTVPVLMSESVEESVKYLEEKFPEMKQKEGQ